MSKNNSQTFWVSVSFLVIGLLIGLLITDKSFLGSAGSQDTEVSNEPPVFDVDKLAVVNVSTDNDALLGSADAKVTMIEFSDYQCPFCYDFWKNTFPKIKSEYIDTGKVKFVYRDFPIPSHPQSQAASESVECVRSVSTTEKDSAYYKMHNLIFGGVTEWSGNASANDVFIGYASTLGVDIKSCLENGDMKSEVADDYTAARGYGVGGTPTFFINGKMVLGAESFEHFQDVIESELK